MISQKYHSTAPHWPKETLLHTKYSGEKNRHSLINKMAAPMAWQDIYMKNSL